MVLFLFPRPQAPSGLELKTRQTQSGGGKEQNSAFFGTNRMPAALWAAAHGLQKLALGRGHRYCPHFIDGETVSGIF